MARFPLHCLQDDESENAFCIGGFQVSQWHHIFRQVFCCAGHIYDNSTLLEADLSLMRVFLG